MLLSAYYLTYLPRSGYLCEQLVAPTKIPDRCGVVGQYVEDRVLTGELIHTVNNITVANEEVMVGLTHGSGPFVDAMLKSGGWFH